MADAEKTTERILMVNLSKIWERPRWKRTKEAVKFLKETLKRRTKVENVRISRALNEKLWSRGIENPPRKLRIRILRIDEKTVRAEPAG